MQNERTCLIEVTARCKTRQVLKTQLLYIVECGLHRTIRALEASSCTFGNASDGIVAYDVSARQSHRWVAGAGGFARNGAAEHRVVQVVIPEVDFDGHFLKVHHARS